MVARTMVRKIAFHTSFKSLVVRSNGRRTQLTVTLAYKDGKYIFPNDEVYPSPVAVSQTHLLTFCSAKQTGLIYNTTSFV